MKTVTLNGLDPGFRAYAELAIAVMQLVTGGQLVTLTPLVVSGGLAPTITSGRRTNAEQQALYEQRDTNPYPVNRPGDSAHEFGLAFDSWVPDEYFPLWREVREYVGLRVPDNDRVHAEWPGWRDLVGRGT